MDLSIVIPLKDEEESLPELCSWIGKVMQENRFTYEIILVDDGSTDHSWEVIERLHKGNPLIRGIKFQRNYGKSAALNEGFKVVKGDVVITMDADLQDSPDEIPSLFQMIKNEGFDLVSGWKKKRYDNVLTKNIPSKFFNSVTRSMSGIHLHDFNCGLKIYRRDVVKAVKVYGELHRYIPVLAHWEGFRIGEQVVRHRPRKFGKTKFGIGRFWKGFLDLLTALFTTRYARRPLHLFGLWGLAAALAGFLIDAWLAVEWYLGRTALSNRPLFLVGVVLMIVGVQFISLGLLGEMITKSQSTGEQYAIKDYIR